MASFWSNDVTIIFRQKSKVNGEGQSGRSERKWPILKQKLNGDDLKTPNANVMTFLIKMVTVIIHFHCRSVRVPFNLGLARGDRFECYKIGYQYFSLTISTFGYSRREDQLLALGQNRTFLSAKLSIYKNKTCNGKLAQLFEEKNLEFILKYLVLTVIIINHQATNIGSVPTVGPRNNNQLVHCGWELVNLQIIC